MAFFKYVFILNLSIYFSHSSRRSSKLEFNKITHPIISSRTVISEPEETEQQYSLALGGYYKGNDEEDNSEEEESLQAEFSDLFSPVRKSSSSKSSFDSDPALSDTIKMISNLCSKDSNFKDMTAHHMRALSLLSNILRGEKDTVSLLQLAKDLRDHPDINKKLWTRAVRVVALERPELMVLHQPNPLQIEAENYMDENVLQEVKLQANLPPKERKCIVLDGRKMTGSIGDEHVLAYFMEDFLVNSQHEFWHTIYSKDLNGLLISSDRRGELFYYFHRFLLSRYQTERLAHGLDFIEPFDIVEGGIVPEGYEPNLKELGGVLPWGNRKPNSQLVNVTEVVGIKEIIKKDINDHVVYHVNGSVISLNNTRGIDYLGDIIESNPVLSINSYRYDIVNLTVNGTDFFSYGLHNLGHDALANLSKITHENGTVLQDGVMSSTAAAMRDPIFYRWHYYIDELFRIHKDTLVPYPRDRGELALRWPGVVIHKVCVVSETTNGIRPSNKLYTSFDTFKVFVPFSVDIEPKEGGDITYCVTALNHAPFKYILHIENKMTKCTVGTIRIFIAPRYNKAGQRFTMEEQRILFFQMEQFSVLLKPGMNKITRRSTEAYGSVTRPWEHFNKTLSDKFYDKNVTSKLKSYPTCGCGWPHHLLVPKGTPQGMHFDLFVMVTNDDNIEQLPSSTPKQCTGAFVMCGNFNDKYPDHRPMGYPFDRRTNLEPTDTLDNFVASLDNIMTIGVTIYHKE